MSASLHRWITVALLSGDVAPTTIDDQIIEKDEATRRAFLRTELELGANGSCDIVDVRGRTIQVNDRIVSKTLGAPDYLKRTPYIPWAPFALRQAVEIWRVSSLWRSTGVRQERDYYLAPLSGHKSYDGYIAIVHEGVVFNLIPARASYMEQQRARGGELVWHAERFSPCVGTCCASILADRTELGKLREQNRDLQRKVTKEKERRRDLERELRELSERNRAVAALGFQEGPLHGPSP